MADAERTLLLKILGDASGAVKAAADAEIGIGGSLSKIGSIAGGVVLGHAFMELPGLLMESVHAAAEHEASMVRLEKAVDNTGVAFASISPEIEHTIAAAKSMAFSGDATRSSLALLTAQTGNAEQAQARFSLAMDLSRGANIDLETASKLLGKVTDENVNVLGRYGISVAKGSSEAELFGAVQQKFGGQAEAFAKSTAGQMEAAQIKMHDLKVEFGEALMPAFSVAADLLNGTVLPAVKGLSEWLLNNKEAMIIIGGAILGVVVPALISMGVATLAPLLPMIAVGAAIGGLVAAVVWLYENWDKVWNAMPSGIQNALKGVTDFAKSMMAIVKQALDWIIDQVNKIQFKVPDWVPGIGGKDVSFAIPHVEDLINIVGGAIGGVVDGIKSKFDAAQPSVTTLNKSIEDMGGAAGGAAAKLDDIAKALQKELIDAYQKGGEQRLAAVQAEQVGMMVTVRATAADIAREFGLSMPEALKIAFDKIDGDAQKMRDTLDKIASDQLTARIEAYMAGGQREADAQATRNAAMLMDAQNMAEKLHDTFGISLPDALTMAMTHLTDSAKALSAATAKAKQDTFDLTKQLWSIMNVSTPGGAAAAAGLAASAVAQEAAAKSVVALGAMIGLSAGDAIHAAGLDVGSSSAPGLATGGIVRARSGGTLVRVGEGGSDEAVIPFGPGAAGVAGVTVNVYVGSALSSSGEIQDAVVTALRQARDRGSAI